MKCTAGECPHATIPPLIPLPLLCVLCASAVKPPSLSPRCVLRTHAAPFLPNALYPRLPPAKCRDTFRNAAIVSAISSLVQNSLMGIAHAPRPAASTPG